LQKPLSTRLLQQATQPARDRQFSLAESGLNSLLFPAPAFLLFCLGLHLSTLSPRGSLTPPKAWPLEEQGLLRHASEEYAARHIPRCAGTAQPGPARRARHGSCRQRLSGASPASLGEMAGSRQGAAARAALTRRGPGPWAVPTGVRSAHTPALPTATCRTRALCSRAPRDAPGLREDHKRGARGAPASVCVPLPGRTQRAAHRAVATGISGNGPSALGLLRLQQEELQGNRLCPTASERAAQDRPHLTESSSAPRQLHWGQGSTPTRPPQHQPCPARPCGRSRGAPGSACPSRDRTQRPLQQLPRHPRLHSCSSTEPCPGSACRSYAGSPPPPSPPRTREPWVTSNCPAQSPQPSHAAAASQVLTSKHRGASDLAWPAMPTGRQSRSLAQGRRY